MKKLVLCAATLLFCAGMLRAQDEQPANPEMQRQELVNLELENARAIKLHNPTFFKAAYSEDFPRGRWRPPNCVIAHWSHTELLRNPQR